MKKWEYKTYSAGRYTDSQWVDDEESLDRLALLGLDGWEMCGVGITITYGGVSQNTFYFKREVNNQNK